MKNNLNTHLVKPVSIIASKPFNHSGFRAFRMRNSERGTRNVPNAEFGLRNAELKVKGEGRRDVNR